MLPRYCTACETLSQRAVDHLMQQFNLTSTGPETGVYEDLRPISHAAACVTLLRAGYRRDAELLLGRPITHLPTSPTSPLLVCGTQTLLDRLAAALPAERGPTPGTGNTRLYDSQRVQWVGPQARRIGPRALGRARLRPGATVGQLLRRGMSRRRLSEATRLGWITLNEPTA